MSNMEWIRKLLKIIRSSHYEVLSGHYLIHEKVGPLLAADMPYLIVIYRYEYEMFSKSEIIINRSHFEH